MKRTLVAGVFWIPVLISALLFDLPWWSAGIFLPAFVVGQSLVQQGTEEKWWS